MYRFVPGTVGGVGSRRKLSHKTCESCKKRHKRCVHDQKTTQLDDRKRSALASSLSFAEIPNLSDPDVNGGLTNNVNGYASVPESQTLSEDGICHAPEQAERPPESSRNRFVGNLSPEAFFFATGNQAVDSDDQRTNVGVWLVSRQPALEKHQDTTLGIDDHGQSTTYASLPLPSSFNLQGMFPQLQKQWISVLPPDYEFKLMSNIYFSKFDPIFPVIHGDNIEELEDIESLTLKQCICLVASLDPSMKPHLRLAHTDGVISQLQFCSRIAETLKSILHTGIIRDKMLLLQITALLAFFVDKPSSSEISSYYCAQAVEISQTLGLHVSRPGETEALEKSHRLFWCIWALDRLNAATNGRPTLIHERDIGEQILAFVPEHLPCFRLFLRICKFLDDVISQYRPRPVLHSNVGEMPVPDYESLVCETAATTVDTPLIASMEIFYLAVRILACQPQSQSGGPNRAPSSDAQSSSAASILSIASGDLKPSISYWVALPYAISLAISVEYQTLRNSKIPYARKRAHYRFHQTREVLDGLGDTFFSARVMARLAQDTLKEARKSRASVTRNRDENSLPTRNHHSGLFTSTDTHLHYTRPPDSPLHPNDFETTTLPPSHLHGILPASDEDWATFDNCSFSEINGGFDALDETFDLSRVDTLFSTNLNPTMPLIPTDWMGF
ncbi:uncharacterized protein N7511_007330 [Penicillium nucicola]|uniref:uncharacterized protein n=1 Tax=Penicillium nucicola TaxID=1850975 RepID=UPI002544F0AF|nr:uncharacterized protein N7511_007330 [Penicillium nucicola]KAJ5757148.1 hypothetical protein N7511_007330 [Penicillium nucicola]